MATARTDRTAVRPRIPEPVRRRTGRTGAGPVEESRWGSGFDVAVVLADDVVEHPRAQPIGQRAGRVVNEA